MSIFQRNAKKLVFLATAAGASSVVFIRLVDMDPVAMGFFRLGFSMLIFTLPAALRGRSGYRGMNARDYAGCALAGFFLFCHFFCWFTAVQNTAITSASVLGTLHPLVIVLVTRLFMGKRTGVKSMIGIVTALAGGAVIVGFDHTMAENNTFGNLMGLLTAVFFGAYLLMGQTMRARIPALNYISLVFGSCLVFFAGAAAATGAPLAGHSARDYLLLFAMAAICQGMAHALLNWCVGYVSSLYVSVCMTMEIVFAASYGAVIFREYPTLWQYAGAATAISGLLYFNVSEAGEGGGS